MSSILLWWLRPFRQIVGVLPERAMVIAAVLRGKGVVYNTHLGAPLTIKPGNPNGVLVTRNVVTGDGLATALEVRSA